MNKILKFFIIIFVIIIIFLFGLAIGNVIISHNQNSNTLNETGANLSTVEISTYIPTNTTKIKISKFENSNNTPFICYISDETQIQSFIKSFSSTSLNDTAIATNITPLYSIDFIGDSSLSVTIYAEKLLQFSTNNTYYFELSDDDFSNIVNLTDVKYYLHNSTLEKPSSSLRTNAKNILMEGLSDIEQSTLKTKVGNTHLGIEHDLVDHINILKDANNIYWEPHTKNIIFTQPNGVRFQSSGFWLDRDELVKLLDLNLNTSIRTIINDIIDKLQTGMDNHDLSLCFEAHKLLHDLDYWIINHPISSLPVAPSDWGGLDCYYGLIEKYNIM